VPVLVMSAVTVSFPLPGMEFADNRRLDSANVVYDRP
jgi:hypothetical protein